MQQLLGWHLPLSHARYWVRGVPDPSLHWQALMDEQGFSQAGWKVEYDRYTRAGTLVLPEKIRLTRPDLRITLVVNHWTTDLQP
jgi:outer membrane lipoprotein LolB